MVVENSHDEETLLQAQISSFEEEEDGVGRDVNVESSDNDNVDDDSDDDNDDDIENDNTSAEETYYSNDDEGSRSMIHSAPLSRGSVREVEDDDRSQSSYSRSRTSSQDDDNSRGGSSSRSSESHSDGSYRSRSSYSGSDSRERRGSSSRSEVQEGSHHSSREGGSRRSDEEGGSSGSSSHYSGDSRRSQYSRSSAASASRKSGDDNDDRSYYSSSRDTSQRGSRLSGNDNNQDDDDYSHGSNDEDDKESYHSKSPTPSRGGSHRDGDDHGSYTSTGRDEGSYSRANDSRRSQSLRRNRRSSASASSRSTEQHDLPLHHDSARSSEKKDEDPPLVRDSAKSSLDRQPRDDEFDEYHSEQKEDDLPLQESARRRLDRQPIEKDLEAAVLHEAADLQEESPDTIGAWPAASWPEDNFGANAAQDFPPMEATATAAAPRTTSDDVAGFGGNDFFGTHSASIEGDTDPFRNDLFKDAGDTWIASDVFGQHLPEEKSLGNDLFGELGGASGLAMDENAFGSEEHQPPWINMKGDGDQPISLTESPSENDAQIPAKNFYFLGESTSPCSDPLLEAIFGGISSKPEELDNIAKDSVTVGQSEGNDTIVESEESHPLKTEEHANEDGMRSRRSLVSKEEASEKEEANEIMLEAAKIENAVDENLSEAPLFEFPDDDFSPDSFDDAPPKPISKERLLSGDFGDDLFENESFQAGPIPFKTTSDSKRDDHSSGFKSNDLFGENDDSKPTSFLVKAESFSGDDGDFFVHGSTTTNKTSGGAFEGSFFGNDQMGATQKVDNFMKQSEEGFFSSQRMDSVSDPDGLFANTASKSVASQSISTRRSRTSGSPGSSRSPFPDIPTGTNDFFRVVTTEPPLPQDTTSDIVSMTSRISRTSRSSRSRAGSSDSMVSCKKSTSPSIAEYLPTILKTSEQRSTDSRSDADPSIGIIDVFGSSICSPEERSHDSSTSLSETSKGNSSMASRRGSVSSRKGRVMKPLVIKEDEELKESTDDLSFGVFSTKHDSDLHLGSFSSPSNSRRSSRRRSRRLSSGSQSSRSKLFDHDSIEQEIKSFINSFSEKSHDSQPTPSRTADHYAISDFGKDLLSEEANETGVAPPMDVDSLATIDIGREQVGTFEAKPDIIDANHANPAQKTSDTPATSQKSLGSASKIRKENAFGENSVPQALANSDGSALSRRSQSSKKDCDEAILSESSGDGLFPSSQAEDAVDSVGSHAPLTFSQDSQFGEMDVIQTEAERVDTTKAGWFETSLTIGDVFGGSKVSTCIQEPVAQEPQKSAMESESDDERKSHVSRSTSQHSGDYYSSESRNTSNRSHSSAPSRETPIYSSASYSRESRRSYPSADERAPDESDEDSRRIRASGSYDQSRSSPSGSFESSQSSQSSRRSDTASDHEAPSVQSGREVSRRSSGSETNGRNHSSRSGSFQSSHASRSSRSYDRSRSGRSRSIGESDHEATSSQSERKDSRRSSGNRTYGQNHSSRSGSFQSSHPSQSSRSFYDQSRSGRSRSIRESDHETPSSQSRREDSRRSSPSRTHGRSHSSRSGSFQSSYASRSSRSSHDRSRSGRSRNIRESDHETPSSQSRREYSRRSSPSRTHGRSHSSRSGSFQSSYESQSSRRSHDRNRRSRSPSIRDASSRNLSSRSSQEGGSSDHDQDSRTDSYKSEGTSQLKQLNESGEELSGSQVSESLHNDSRRTKRTEKRCDSAESSTDNYFHARDPSGKLIDSPGSSFVNKVTGGSDQFSKQGDEEKSHSTRSRHSSRSTDRISPFGENDERSHRSIQRKLADDESAKSFFVDNNRTRSSRSEIVVSPFGRDDGESRRSFGGSDSSSAKSDVQSTHFSSQRRHPPSTPETEDKTRKGSSSSFDASFSSRSYEKRSHSSHAQHTENSTVGIQASYSPPTLYQDPPDPVIQPISAQSSSQATGESSESSRRPILRREHNEQHARDEEQSSATEASSGGSANPYVYPTTKDESVDESSPIPSVIPEKLPNSLLPKSIDVLTLPPSRLTLGMTASTELAPTESRSLQSLRSLGIMMATKKETVHVSIRNEGYLNAVEGAYIMLLQLRPRIRYMLALSEWCHIHALMLYARVFDCELAAARIVQPRSEFRIQLPRNLQVLEPLATVLESIGIVEDASLGVRYVPVAKPLHKKTSLDTNAGNQHTYTYEPPDPDDVTEFLEWTQYPWNSSWIKVEQAREARKVMAAADGIQLPEKIFPVNHSRLLEWENLALEKWLGWDENLWFSYDQTVRMLGRKFSFVHFPKKSALGTYAWLLPLEVVDRKSSTITSKKFKATESVIAKVPTPLLGAEVWSIALLFNFSALPEDRTTTWYHRTNPVKNPSGGPLQTFLESAIIPK